MVILVDTEHVFDKTQYSFMIKKVTFGIEGTQHNKVHS
jgi:hypothetical protein